MFRLVADVLGWTGDVLKKVSINLLTAVGIIFIVYILLKLLL